MNNSGFNLRKMLSMFALIPLITTLVIMTVISTEYMRMKLSDQTENTLQVAAMALKEYYAYDFISNDLTDDGWVTYDPDYMDHLQDAGVDLTLFRGDTRFCTSILDENGKRIEGTKASDEVIEEVLKKGNDFSDNDVYINNERYYVYYVPMRDSNNNIVGMAFAGMKYEKVNKAVGNMRIVALGIAIVLMGIFSGLCVYFTRVIATPLKLCADSLTKLSEGDLKATNDAVSKVSETKAIIFASNTLRDKMSEIIGEIKNVSGELNDDANNVGDLSDASSSSVSQISSAMEDLAEGSTEMACNVQDIAKSVSDMNETIAMLTESSEALTTSSEKIRTANDEASNYISKVSDSSVQTVEAVHDITRQISNTNDAVQKIKEAVDMITSITSQTNLLALNASIEAARAGEAGRGFAVVASEIGNLSDQSGKSANEIRKIVDEIVRNSEASVELSAGVAKLITEEQQYIKDTQDKFDTLKTEINGSLENIRQVSDDTVNLEKIQSVITDAVQSLSAISQENAASNEEVSASITGIATSVDEIASSADKTRANSEKLVGMVSYFH